MTTTFNSFIWHNTHTQKHTEKLEASYEFDDFFYYIHRRQDKVEIYIVRINIIIVRYSNTILFKFFIYF